jgi:hypothetical protein
MKTTSTLEKEKNVANLLPPLPGTPAVPLPFLSQLSPPVFTQLLATLLAASPAAASFSHGLSRDSAHRLYHDFSRSPRSYSHCSARNSFRSPSFSQPSPRCCASPQSQIFPEPSPQSFPQFFLVALTTVVPLEMPLENRITSEHQNQPSRAPSGPPASPCLGSNEPCRRLNSGCACEFPHRCSFDPTRYRGLVHAAINCHLICRADNSEFPQLME